MAVVLLAFGGSLLYFLFFNSGLNISPDPSDQVGKVIVSNDSVHAIRDVNVSYLLSGKKVGGEWIDVLLPRETRTIEMDPHFLVDGKYVVQVSAPYHLSKQVVVQALTNTNAPPAISVTFEVSSVGTQFEPVSIRLLGRSLDSLSHVVNASLELSDPSSGENPPVVEWGVSPDVESSITLSFTPLTAREDLSFKIKVFTPSNVLVEREYTMLVVPNPDENTMDENAFSNTPDGNSSLSVTTSSDSNSFSDANVSSDVNMSSDTNSSLDSNGSES